MTLFESAATVVSALKFVVCGLNAEIEYESLWTSMPIALII